MDLLGMISFLETRELKDKIHIYNVVDFGASPLLGDNRYNIQLALYEAKNSGGHSIVYVPPGVYKTKGMLRIGDNTTLMLSNQTTIQRNAEFDCMIIGDGPADVGGYAKNTNINIIGGTWDANKAAFTSGISTIAFAHATNVVIKDATFKNNPFFHMIECNSSKNVMIDNCKFLDYGGNSSETEAIQIDHSWNQGFPWGGVFDDTFCRNITIQNCYFSNGFTAIGTHAGVQWKLHRDIKIIGNYFENHRAETIKAFGWSDVKIEKNYFIDAFYGIYLYTDGTTTSDNVHIKGNTFKQISKNIESRAINLKGNKGTTGHFKHCIISENFVDGVGKHGIGADYCTHIQFLNNTVMNCNNVGLWVGYGGSNFVVVGNTVINNVAGGAAYTHDLQIGYESGGVNYVIAHSNHVGKLAFNVVNYSNIQNNVSSALTVGTHTGSIIKGNMVNGVITNTTA